MLKSMLLASIAGVAISAWADKAAAAASDPSPPPQTISDPVQRAQAIQEIQEMKARIGRIEQALGLPAEPPPVQYSPALNKAAPTIIWSFMASSSSTRSRTSNASTRFGTRRCARRRFPTTEGQFGSDGQSIFSVRQSRLGAKATGTLAGKPYEAKFEFDLFGTGVDAGQTTFRMRHVYASWGPFLAGQTNTLFMDGDMFPNVDRLLGPDGHGVRPQPADPLDLLRQRRLERRGRARASERRHRPRQHPPDRSRTRREHPGRTKSCPT